MRINSWFRLSASGHFDGIEAVPSQQINIAASSKLALRGLNLDERRFGLVPVSCELPNGPTQEAILLRPVVEAFLAKTGVRPMSACFDVAGPVIDGPTRLTNLAWDLDETELCKGLGLARVTPLNDLNAIAHAIPHLKPEELVCINPGKAKPQGRSR
jgi:hypothetical protein